MNAAAVDQVVPGEAGFAVFGFSIAVLMCLFTLTMIGLAIGDGIANLAAARRARLEDEVRRAAASQKQAVDDAAWNQVLAFPGEPRHLAAVAPIAQGGVIEFPRPTVI